MNSRVPLGSGRRRRGCAKQRLAKAKLSFDIGERLRTEAKSEADLCVAKKCFEASLRCAPRHASKLRSRSIERLLLMVSQREETAGPYAAWLLHKGGFVCRLSPSLLNYDSPSAQFAAPQWPPSGFAHAVDRALPVGLLRGVQAAFAPDSPFWSEHNYACGSSPFFSYVHPLGTPPRVSFDRVLAVLHSVACAHFPRARSARYAEWWAHCRPHGVGHQLHFDSDDEGEGGVRNPLVSSALYLTSGVGGPTLVTDQRLGQPLARRGWHILPDENRYLLFDGTLLHGVVPGSGVVAPEAGASDHMSECSRRRVSLMVAFWPSIEQRSSPAPCAARPFPFARALAQVGEDSGCRWPSLFDWPEDSDASAGAPGAAAVSIPLRPVQPVWELVSGTSSQSDDGTASSAADQSQRLYSLRSMPAYEECFQGLC